MSYSAKASIQFFGPSRREAVRSGRPTEVCPFLCSTLSSRDHSNIQIRTDASVAMQKRVCAKQEDPLHSSGRTPTSLVATAVYRVAVICAACILGVRVLIHRSATVVLGQELLFDFPIALFGADAKLEIFLGDGIPVLYTQVSDCGLGFRTKRGRYG